MREIQIDLSTTGKIVDDVTFSVGATAKTVEEESCFYNYFFFTATSVNFMSSTMTLKYDEYPGWTPEAWLAICNQDVARETYAIKIKTPKYSSSTGSIENRTVYTVGNIQTDSPSVNSDYNIAVRTNACPEMGDYRLLYVTNVNDNETYTIMNSSGSEEKIVFNVQYVVEKNIDFFTGDDDEGHDKKEATMLNIVARKEWGERDGDWDSYSTGPVDNYKYEAYRTCEDQPDTEPNARIVKKDSTTILGSGFFNLESGSPSKLEYLSAYTFNGEIGTGEGKFIFEKPLEAIGYHTFFFGKHLNNTRYEPEPGDEYLDYRDLGGNWQRFSHKTTNGSSEWKIGDEKWIDFDDKLNCKRDNEQQSNEVNVYFDELNDIITSIKTGKYLRIIGNQAFKLLKNLQEVDLEGSPLERIGMYAFEGCLSLNTFEIPDSVLLIGEGAFKKSGISEVKIPSGLKYIESETFRLCDNLSSVDFSSCTGLTKICANAFRQTNLNSLSLPSGLKNIEKMAFAQCDNLSNVTFNDDLEYIGYKAFDRCKSLESVEIPAETIGEMAFHRCEGLLNVTLKSSVRTVNSGAFEHCNISTLTIENGLENIKEYAFKNIGEVTSIELPDSVLTIGERAFIKNDSLETVKIGNGVRDIGDYVFGESEVTIVNIGNNVEHIGNSTFVNATIQQESLPATLQTIGERAFSNCNGLSVLLIPNKVTSVGAYAFNHCKDIERVVISTGMTVIASNTFSSCINLSFVSIPNRITSIGEEAFMGCISLGAITIPDSVTTIGTRAFFECHSMPSLVIPKNVSNIGTSAFSWCSGLSSIRVDSGNRVYDSRNNCNAIIETATNTLLFGCNNTTIPNSVTTIKSEAFVGRTGLTSFSIPNSVTSIGRRAFSGCTNLATINIPQSITAIEDNTFNRCSSLTSIVIPNNVTDIKDYAFWYCTSLAAVTLGDNIESIGDSAFYGCGNLTEVTFPVSLKYLASGAFSYCRKIEKYIYKGTKEQWGKVKRDWWWITDWNPKTNGEIECIDGYASFYYGM